jgi:hypothetical protein
VKGIVATAIRNCRLEGAVAIDQTVYVVHTCVFSSGATDIRVLSGVRNQGWSLLTIACCCDCTDLLRGAFVVEGA